MESSVAMNEAVAELDAMFKPHRCRPGNCFAYRPVDRWYVVGGATGAPSALVLAAPRRASLGSVSWRPGCSIPNRR